MQRYDARRMPDTMRVWTLGGFQVSVGTCTIAESSWRLRKAAAMVKLLALSPGHRLHREQMMDILWAHLGKQAAANNLRRTLHAARRALESESAPTDRYLSLRGEQIALHPGGLLWVDVEMFEEAAATARCAPDPAAYRAAVDLYAGDLLPEDRYEEWAEGRRAELRRLYLDLLVELATLYEERGEHGRAIEALRRVLSEEPVREEAHADLMRLYALSGRRREAIRQYERLEGILRGELGAEPAAESQNLRGEIVAGSFLPVQDRFSGEHPGVGQHNLPRATTSFVGRESEVLEIKQSLAMTRLLTLTGTGGVGKTRLALEVAQELAFSYPDGVWLVELAGLSEGAHVPQAVALALEVREQPGRCLTDTLVDAMGEKKLLLLLDNCEHLTKAAAGVAEALLSSCPRLRILATSRESVRVSGEVTWRVPPLSVPHAADRPLEPEDLGRHEAIRLFLERARLKLPTFELTPDNARAIAEVCRKLDGIPLAIELAAARMDVLAVGQISERLRDSLKLLTGGDRTAMPRQQTLRETMDWSYNLLSGPEKKLLCRLSTFAGGWTLEAAEAVGAGEGVEESDVLDLLSGLVNKSLVIAERAQEDGMRYRLLEPIRQYAREKLEESGETEAASHRHATFFLAFAEEAEPKLMGARQGEWMERLESEYDNLRAALGRSLDREEQVGLRLAAALWWFWYARGHLSEGRRWLEGYLSRCRPGVSEARAKALNGAGWIAIFHGQFQDAKAYGQEALALFRELEDDEGVASALVYLGGAAVLGQLDDVPVLVLLEEATKLRSEIRDPRTIGNLSVLSGLFAAVRGEFDQSEALLGEALTLFRKIGDKTGICHCLTGWGLGALSVRAYEKAYRLFRENLRVAWESGHTVTMQSSLLGLGVVAISQEQPARAARLWGAVEALEEAYGIRMTPAGLSLAGYEGYLALARSRLGEEEFAAAWAEGKAMTQEEATEYALGRIEPFPSAAPEPETGSANKLTRKLTRREREVAVLVDRGMTNRCIASELVISERTVETHVHNVLRKLGLGSRAQLAAWMTRRRPLDDVG